MLQTLRTTNDWMKLPTPTESNEGNFLLRAMHDYACRDPQIADEFCRFVQDFHKSIVHSITDEEALCLCDFGISGRICRVDNKNGYLCLLAEMTHNSLNKIFQSAGKEKI